MRQSDYDQLLELARRALRWSSDAEDLLQDALIEAIRTGRADFGRMDNRHWLRGVVRNKARMLARGAVRRRGRENDWSDGRQEPDRDGAQDVTGLLTGLPPSLKSVAALALSGHTRREIAYLLRLEDAALRQRVSQLRRRFAVAGLAMPGGMPGLNLDLAYGRIREALLPALLRQGGVFASHDPDGHLFVVTRSQKPRVRQLQA